MWYLKPVCLFIILTFSQAENSSNRIDLTEVTNGKLEMFNGLAEVLEMDPMVLPDLAKETWAIAIYFSKGHLKGLSRMGSIKDFLIMFENGRMHISASFHYDTLDAVYDYLIKMMFKSYGSIKVAVTDTTVNLNISLNIISRNLDNISINIPHIGGIDFGESSLVGHIKNLMGSNPQDFIKNQAEQQINDHLKKIVGSINKGSFVSYENLENITRYDVEYRRSVLEDGVSSVIKHFKWIN